MTTENVERPENYSATANKRDTLISIAGSAAGNALVRVRESLRTAYRAPVVPAVGTAVTAVPIPDSTAKAIESVFAEFGVAATVTDSVRGPAVTTYLIRPGAGVKVEKVTQLRQNVALKLGTVHIRFVPVVAGRPGVMGVEVPNKRRDAVRLPDLLAGLTERGPLLVPLGADTTGVPVVVNLAAMPHVLVGGETGAGKSVVLNAIICSLLARNTPRRLGLLLVDPKQVELAPYAGVPHLVAPIVTDPRKAAGALGLFVGEMEDRFDRLRAAGVRNVAEYNRQVPKAERLRYLVAVVDELADLMLVAGVDVEKAVLRLGQLARAAGIHLVLATQRPSVDVVTGLIKANMPARLALTAASLVDSRVILDQSGAEKLIGRGDALLSAPGMGGLVRLQCAFVSDDEIAQVVAHAKTYGPRPSAPLSLVPSPTPEPETGDDVDGLLDQAEQLVVASESGSTSMLQRKLGIGYAKAGRLMDQLEERGIVGPANGTKAREVLRKPDAA